MAERSLTIVRCGPRLAVSWVGLSHAEHDRLVGTLRSIPGATYDATTKAWCVPVRQADRLIEALPEACYDYDAVCAACDAASERTARFMRNLRALGVRFVERDGQVLALGDHVSPLVQKLVAERNAAALAWLKENPEPTSTSNAATPERDACDWRQAELLTASLHNAARNQYQQEKLWKKKKRSQSW